MKNGLVLLGLVAGLALGGCSRTGDANTNQMSTEEIIRQHRNSPIGESINVVVKSLAKQTVFVGTEGVTPTEDGKIAGTVRLKTGLDNQGRPWVYAYTSRGEFDKAFPQGGAFAEMEFRDLFKLVETNQQFAGLQINSASDATCPIPRELFDQVRRVLQEASGG